MYIYILFAEYNGAVIKYFEQLQPLLDFNLKFRAKCIILS